MEIIAIEDKTFEQMKLRFEAFTKEIKELCGEKNDTKWVDNEDVCRLLQISKRTLQSYRDNGTLSYSQIGYKCYYKKSDIEKLVEESITKNDRHGNKG